MSVQTAYQGAAQAHTIDEQAKWRLLLNLAREKLVILNYQHDGAWISRAAHAEPNAQWLAGLHANSLGEPCQMSNIFWPKPLSSLAKLLDFVGLIDQPIGLSILANHQTNQRIESYRLSLGQLEWQTLWKLYRQNMTGIVEQLGADGHPTHPVERLKIGWSEQQEQDWSAEYNASYAMPIFALAKTHAQTPVSFNGFFSTHFAKTFALWQQALQRQGLDPLNYYPLPVHPGQQGVAQQAQGTVNTSVSLQVRPGISQRSVYAGDQAEMIKVPMDVRTTSAMRHLSTRSCQVGPTLSKWLKHYVKSQLGQRIDRTDNTDLTKFTVLGEYDGMYHTTLQGRLSVLYREGALDYCHPDETAICTASFLANRRGASLAQQLLGDDMTAFSDYCRTVLTAPFAVYLQTGLALEAHQQNTLLRIKQSGRVTGFMVRDFGAPRISQFDTHHVDIDWNIAQSLVVPDRATARAKLIHSLLLCHISVLIEQLGRTSERWSVVKSLITDCVSQSPLSSEHKAQELAGFCQQPWQVKALLSMWQQSDYQYAQVANPMVGL